MTSTILRLRDVHKAYPQSTGQLVVLDGAELTITAGEMVGLVGPSGCGKSTLLQIAGLLDTPDRGDVQMIGEQTHSLSDVARTRLRNKALGFVYQQHHLMADFSALENVMMPQALAGNATAKARDHAQTLLVQMGLKDRMSHRPAALSGGEQQRVAIARALANNPALLLADEPTGNLDPDTANTVFTVLLEYARQHKAAMLMVTHNPLLAKKMDRQITLKNHKIIAG